MAGPNPKIASMSVTMIAVAALQAGTLFLVISEQTATGGPRLDRFLSQFILLGVLWTAVALVDLFVFPNMRMTRLVAGPAFSIAAVIMAFQAAFQLADRIFGTSVTGPTNRIAFLGFSFAATWALTSLWGLLRERLRASRHHETGSVEYAHQSTTDVVDAPR